MKTKRMRLKTRVIIALAAIAVIHLSFYAVPRWWYSRVRPHDEAYERAVGLLREKFGDAAVDKGVIVIPETALSVPYEGQATIRDVTGGYISLSKRGAYLVCTSHDSGQERLAAARVSYAHARLLWALFAYLERAEVKDALGTSGKVHVYACYSDFSDRTWPWSRAADRKVKEPKGYYDASSPEVFARSLLRSRALAELMASEETGLAEDPRAVAPALAAIIEGSLPVYNRINAARLTRFTEHYANLVGRRGLPLLEKIQRLNEQRLESTSRWRPDWMYKLPVVGPWLRRKDFEEIPSGYEIVYPQADQEIWVIKALEGKPPGERLRVLSETAFADDRAFQASIREKARRLLEAEYPQAYYDLLVENFADLYDRKRTSAYLPYWWFAAVRADERFANLVAGDDRSLEHPWVCEELYKRTGDAAYIDRLKEIVETNADDNLDTAREATRALFEAYQGRKDAVDAPAFARGLIHEIKPPQDQRSGSGKRHYLGRHIVRFCLETGSGECRRLLEDMLLRPADTFDGGYAATEAATALRAAAAKALGRWPDGAGLPALLNFLKSAEATLNAELALGVIDALGDSGAPAAIEPLAEMLQAASRRDPRQSGHEPPQVEGSELTARVRRATATIRLKSAEDPLQCFLALDASDRTLVTMPTLARVFSADELRRLLADDSCKTRRADVLIALFVRERRLLEPDVVAEQGNSVPDDGLF